ncbi:hypothetical protein YPPY02_1824, partial [Yersinia pestis PY-02]
MIQYGLFLRWCHGDRVFMAVTMDPHFVSSRG